MSTIDMQKLSGVSETLLITLYLRAMESQRPDALIKDEKAVELVSNTTWIYDFGRIKAPPSERGEQAGDHPAQPGIRPLRTGFPGAPPGRGGGSHRVRPRYALRARG